MKKRLWLATALVAVSCASVAYATRAYTWEVGYFAADGVSMNGSELYPCTGPVLVSGELVGTPRVIWKESCLCAPDDACDHWGDH
jgi:hypothetical protein